MTDIGVKVQRTQPGTLVFQADDLNLAYLQSTEFVKKCSSLRGSVLMIGPLLGRFRQATIAKPGGDKIGRRRLDTHFLGFKYLGAQFVRRPDNDHVFDIKAEKLRGRSTMRPANPTSSSCVVCSTRWEQTLPGLAATC